MNEIFKCNVDGYNLAYTREGSGQPILLVHGITTYSFIWRKIIPLLSSNYDVIAIDLMGCGSSDKSLDVDYSIKNHANIIAKFIKKMELKKIHLVAHDVGGGIAQILAVKYIELIKDVTLINSVAYDYWPVQPIIALRTPILRQIAMSALDFGALRLIVKRGIYNHEFFTDELMELFWKPMTSRLGRKAFLRFAEGLNNNHLLEITDQLHSIEMPFLIIRGEADLYLSADISETLHKNIKGSIIIKIPNASHYIMEEKPAQITNEIIKFLKGN